MISSTIRMRQVAITVGFRLLSSTRMKPNSNLWKYKVLQGGQGFFCSVVLLMVFFTVGCGLLSALGDFMLSGVHENIFLNRKVGKLDEMTHGIRAADNIKENARCSGRRVFMYEIPELFNQGVVGTYCNPNTTYADTCENLSNKGMGPEISYLARQEELQPADAWYRTDQFSLELLFHERVKEYACLTKDSDTANLFYMPFYAALDVTRYLFSKEIHLRDRLSQRFLGWITAQPQFLRHQGRKHFMVLGRIVWDFMREEESSTWGNPLLRFSELENVTKLLIERDPSSDRAHGRQIAVPYPTSFHPKHNRELQLWQAQVRTQHRDITMAFAGGPRTVDGGNGHLRNALFDQCTNSDSSNCTVLNCRHINCPSNPQLLTKLFLRSVFCLQPPGDSPTRKAVFDSMVSGCIPVFFAERTAYTQYLWHLPTQPESYSVMFSEELVRNGLNVLDELLKIPAARVKSMQNVIIDDILPIIVYHSPGRDGNTTKDAFDVILDKLLDPNVNT